MKTFLLSLLLTSSAMALTPPKPSQGSPMFSGKSYEMGCGSCTYTFAFPQGWGMGECSTSAGRGEGRFMLYPAKGGTGCSMDFRRWGSKEQAAEEMLRLRMTFETSYELAKGFEVVLPHGWYSCQQFGEHLLEAWYILPKKATAADRKIWQLLRDCAKVAQITEQVASLDTGPVLIEKRGGKWLCHHPDQKLHVEFESGPLRTCTANIDPERLYTIRFKDHHWGGFLFVKWDQDGLETVGPYRVHLEEMLVDLRKEFPQQRVYGEPEFFEEDKLAIWRGSPYTLVSCSANEDPFLFGLAVEPKTTFHTDFSDVVQAVGWYRTE